MIPVILSGGSGTRLWPLSRSQYPKQFLPLVSRQHTMIQQTLLRLEGLPGVAPAIAVCNEDHRFMMAEQLRELGRAPTAILLEPVGKNTAPAVTLAALTTEPDDVLLILPADHVIADVKAFQAVLSWALPLAQEGLMVTFGIVPSAPETGYGYIQAATDQHASAYRIARFVEKPDMATAERYLAEGGYYWNSGMFMFTADTFLTELERLNPAMLSACRSALAGAQKDLDFTRVDKQAFSACPADSIDYAVMEHTQKGVVLPLDAGWNDVGSWSALWDVTDKNATGNAVFGDVLTYDTENCYLYAGGKLVTALGVRDLVIVDTDDALLVASKDKVQEVKAIVDDLKQQNRPEAVVHRKVYRPWGFYDAIDYGDRHQAKRIVVKPGARLSLQKHHHRAEHWVIVKGTALVTKGDSQELLTENQSTYIPLGTVHCLENPGVIPLEMIEVQSGSYLGEDDIVRYKDNYGRT